ncbi:unnamed protein product, partial [Nesidiocoris tenuis]
MPYVNKRTCTNSAELNRRTCTSSAELNMRRCTSGTGLNERRCTRPKNLFAPVNLNFFQFPAFNSIHNMYIMSVPPLFLGTCIILYKVGIDFKMGCSEEEFSPCYKACMCRLLSSQIRNAIITNATSPSRQIVMRPSPVVSLSKRKT